MGNGTETRETTCYLVAESIIIFLNAIIMNLENRNHLNYGLDIDGEGKGCETSEP
jgi:hypothetical protein